MAEIIRSWRCLNARCAREFTAWEANPACPDCGCIRVQWMPGGGHCGGTAKACDAALRDLANVFKMNDIASAKEGERAMPKLPARTGEAGPAMQFGPGFAQIPFVKDKQGHAMSVCGPSMAKVDFKAKVGTGIPLAASSTYPHPRTNTRVEASHRGGK